MPSLGKAVAALFLAAVLGLAVRFFYDRIGVFWTGVLIAALVALGVYGAATFIDWFRWSNTARLLEVRQAMAISEATEALRLMSAFSPVAQVELAMRMPGLWGAKWNGLISNIGPTYSIPIKGYDIPDWFVDKFFEMSDDHYLVPVRTFSENSNERRWTQALTDWFVMFDYAEKATGPHSARWVGDGFARAKLAFFGVQDAQD